MTERKIWWKRWIWNILVAFDQFWNAILAGDPDETISSRAGKAKREDKKWACILCRFLDIFDESHCREAVNEDDGDDQIWKD